MSALRGGALELARQVNASGQHPLALLDLDLTLIDNGPRTRAILNHWVSGLSGRLEGAQWDAAMERVQGMPLVFSIRSNLLRVLGKEAGEVDVETAALAKEGFQLWLEHFFDPAWLVHDVALERAVEAVWELVKNDVTVAYVTARKVNMVAGTVASLRNLGFPMGGPYSTLIMNDHPTRSDHDSKVVALEYCARLGTVVLNAENEPAHANAMHRRFPEALTVLIATRHSEPAPPLDAGVVRVNRLSDAL